MPTALPHTHELERVNREFYEPLWGSAKLIRPQRFNTWPLVSMLVGQSRQSLEVAPGLRPRLPLERAEFIDMSEHAVAALQAVGAKARVGSVEELPFATSTFDLVCAFDIVEHVEDDEAALTELTRVLAPGGVLLMSVPLHESYWTQFDELVGHCRRYEPENLAALLAPLKLTIEHSAVFGMQPKSSKLLDLGVWYMTHQRERAMWWYNHVFMPLGAYFQRPLRLRPGLIETSGVDEVLLVCRKSVGREPGRVTEH
jgi:SAM-dependent methyltransferase